MSAISGYIDAKPRRWLLKYENMGLINMIEKELKVLITKTQYQKISQAFQWDQVIEQTNHYYLDARGVIKENHITVRVREIGGKYELQVKYPVQRKGEGFSQAVVIRGEHQENLDGLPEILEGQKVASITGVNSDDLYPVGSLFTRRDIFLSDQQTTVCLDKNRYLAEEDYELEIEFTSTINETLFSCLSELGINFEQKAIGKFTRLMSKYNQKQS